MGTEQPHHLVEVASRVRGGLVRALRLAGAWGEPMRTVESAIAEAERGFVGDRLP